MQIVGLHDARELSLPNVNTLGTISIRNHNLDIADAYSRVLTKSSYEYFTFTRNDVVLPAAHKIQNYVDISMYYWQRDRQTDWLASFSVVVRNRNHQLADC